jgi:hypothetical protein
MENPQESDFSYDDVIGIEANEVAETVSIFMAELCYLELAAANYVIWNRVKSLK